MKILVPFVFWCAAGFFLIGAYPLSPPDQVPGWSANRLANIFFLATTVWLVVRAFLLGRSRKGCCRKERIFRRLTYIWLCVIIIFMFLGLNHIVRMGSVYERTPFFVSYLTLLGVMAAVFCLLAYQKRKAGMNDKEQ